jgi:hypothetical protein
MNRAKEKKLAVAVCVMLSAALIGLFFAPWTKFSMMATAGSASMEETETDAPEPEDEIRLVGTATGWELARGYLTDPSEEPAPSTPRNASIVARPWFLAGFAIPVAAIVITLLANQMRRVRVHGVLLLPLAVGGAMVALSTHLVNYADDLLEDLPESAYAASELNAFLTRELTNTAPMWGAWASVVLYAMLAAFGLVFIVIGDTKQRPRATTDA